MDQSTFMEALKLLVIGMVTVFIILLIVINLGKLLISLVNKFAPAEETKKKVAASATAGNVDQNTMAIIKAAVSQLTNGKGNVTGVKRI